jgi:hypothetical protein
MAPTALGGGSTEGVGGHLSLRKDMDGAEERSQFLFLSLRLLVTRWWVHHRFDWEDGNRELWD